MKYGSKFAILLVAVGLSACSASQVSVDRIQVEQTVQSIVLERDEINENMLARLADDYKKTSEGGMDVFVSYPNGLMGAEAQATRTARHYKHVLQDKGVAQVNVMTVPMDSPEYDQRVIISYKGYTAEAPKDCGRIPGVWGGEGIDEIKKYQIGCEHMRYTSKMVADPRDLLGKSRTQDGDARRAGNVVEAYQTGEPLPELDISTASDVGQ